MREPCFRGTWCHPKTSVRGRLHGTEVGWWAAAWRAPQRPTTARRKRHPAPPDSDQPRTRHRQRSGGRWCHQAESRAGATGKRVGGSLAKPARRLRASADGLSGCWGAERRQRSRRRSHPDLAAECHTGRRRRDSREGSRWKGDQQCSMVGPPAAATAGGSSDIATAGPSSEHRRCSRLMAQPPRRLAQSPVQLASEPRWRTRRGALAGKRRRHTSQRRKRRHTAAAVGKHTKAPVGTQPTYPQRAAAAGRRPAARRPSGQ